MSDDADDDGAAPESGTDPDYRFTLANERTFLAWFRTALALIAGGVAVVQLVPQFAFPGARHILGTLLTVGAVRTLSVAAVRRWQRVPWACATTRTCRRPGSRRCSVLRSPR